MKPIQYYVPKTPFFDNILSFGHATRRLGYIPNILQPKTFSEHLLKLKLNFQGSERNKKVTDKESFKKHLSDKGKGSLVIPTIMITKDVNELRNITLNGPVIVKPTHSSGKYRIFRESIISFTDTDLKAFDDWLREDYYVRSRERNYRYLTPKLIIEPLLQTDVGALPRDYKVFCVNGAPKAIQVDIDRETDHKRAIFDTHWNKLSYSMYYDRFEDDLICPEQLERMLEIAKDLSSEFEFVRLDFYLLSDSIKLGEFTFFPGNCAERFHPISGDREFGKLLFGSR